MYISNFQEEMYIHNCQVDERDRERESLKWIVAILSILTKNVNESIIHNPNTLKMSFFAKLPWQTYLFFLRQALTVT